MRSGVAGLSRGNQSWWPDSDLAATMASFIAKNTDDARKNGGSPTAFEEWMAFTFGAPCSKLLINKNTDSQKQKKDLMTRTFLRGNLKHFTLFFMKRW